MKKKNASTVSLNELVGLVEKHIGTAVQVSYQGREQLLQRTNTTLPRAKGLAREFPKLYPRGLEQVRSVIADLEVSVALGAFDLEVMAGSDTMDLTAEFRDTTEPPMTIERLMETAWGEHLKWQSWAKSHQSCFFQKSLGYLLPK